MRRIASLVVFAIYLNGCYSWHAIKPTELPKLNGGSTTLTNAGGRQIALITVAKVEGTDGRMIEIKGESNARVSVQGSAPLLFEHPESEIQGSDLAIRSINRTKTTIPLNTIQKVEVSQYEPVQSTLAYMLPGILFLVVVLAAM